MNKRIKLRDGNIFIDPCVMASITEYLKPVDMCNFSCINRCCRDAIKKIVKDVIFSISSKLFKRIKEDDEENKENKENNEPIENDEIYEVKLQKFYYLLKAFKICYGDYALICKNCVNVASDDLCDYFCSCCLDFICRKCEIRCSECNSIVCKECIRFCPHPNQEQSQIQCKKCYYENNPTSEPKLKSKLKITKTMNVIFRLTILFAHPRNDLIKHLFKSQGIQIEVCNSCFSIYHYSLFKCDDCKSRQCHNCRRLPHICDKNQVF